LVEPAELFLGNPASEAITGRLKLLFGMIVPGMSQETEAHLEKMLWKYDKDSFVMPMK